MAIVNAKRGAIVNPMNLLHCAMRMPPFLSTLQCNTKNAFIVPHAQYDPYPPTLGGGLKKAKGDKICAEHTI